MELLRKARLGACLLMILIGAVLMPQGAFAVSSQTDDGVTAIEGDFKIAQVEREPYDKPLENSADWASYRLGPAGLDHELDHEEGVAWVAVDFLYSGEYGDKELSLLIAQPADAVEAYLNDVRVGEAGAIKSYYVITPGGPGKLDLPEGLLKEGMNRLEMKVLFAGRNMAVFDGPILLGEKHRISAEFEKLKQPILAEEAGFLSVFLVITVVYCFLIIQGVVRSEYVLFLGFVIVYSTLFTFDSSLLQSTGLFPQWLPTLQIVFSPIRALLMFLLVSRLSNAPRGLIFKFTLVLAVVFVVLYIAVPPLLCLTLLAHPRKFFLVFLGAYYLYMTIPPMLNKKDDAIPLFIGVVAYVLGSRMDLFIGTDIRVFTFGLFSLSMLYVLTARHARMNNRVLALSTKLMDAHEEERKRIARDIHDGVGQSLVGLKLRFQMASTKLRQDCANGAELLDRFVADISTIIEEVRRTAMDLRPRHLENSSLEDAIAWYAESFVQDSGMKLNFHRGAGLPKTLPSRIKDNVFRIVQEIIGNSIKHSGAGQIDISLHSEGKKLLLTVFDNGKGFDSSAVKAGLGLETMRERTELLGGACTVKSEEGVGTTIKIEVPYND